MRLPRTRTYGPPDGEAIIDPASYQGEQIGLVRCWPMSMIEGNARAFTWDSGSYHGNAREITGTTGNPGENGELIANGTTANLRVEDTEIGAATYIETSFNDSAATVQASWNATDFSGIGFAWWQRWSANSATNSFSLGTIVGYLPYTDGKYYFDFGGSDATRRVSAAGPVQYEWHHVWLYAEGASGFGGGQGIDIDGLPLVTSSNTGEPSGAQTQLRLRHTGTWAGHIRDFRIYNNPLSPEMRFDIAQNGGDLYWQRARSYHWIHAGAPPAGTLPPIFHHHRHHNRAA